MAAAVGLLDDLMFRLDDLDSDSDSGEHHHHHHHHHHHRHRLHRHQHHQHHHLQHQHLSRPSHGPLAASDSRQVASPQASEEGDGDHSVLHLDIAATRKDILRHSRSDPMLTSPQCRNALDARQIAVAHRLLALQQQQQQQQRNSVDEEDFPFQAVFEQDRHDEDCIFDEDEDLDPVDRFVLGRAHIDDTVDGYENVCGVHEDGEDYDVTIAPPTIEQIKDDYNSCFSCGVSWSENHVSLDCPECGGYALTRPCLSCEGRCNAQWTRNLAASHGNRQARWEGRCTLVAAVPLAQAQAPLPAHRAHHFLHRRR